MEIIKRESAITYDLIGLTEDEAGALFGVLVNLCEKTPGKGPDHNEATKALYERLSDALPAFVKDRWMAYNTTLHWTVP